MPFIQVRGVAHYYEWIRSSENTETKPVMVFMHGWGGSARYWESTARALANWFDCLLYDMRGFGRSANQSSERSLPALRSEQSCNVQDISRQDIIKPSIAGSVSDIELVSQTESELVQDTPATAAELSYELESYADDLAALLNALNLSRVYINAHSMGASVAAFFLNRYPQRVERAILTCSGIFEYDEKAFAAFHKFGGYVVKFRPRWLAKIPFVDKMFMARFLHRPLPRFVSRAFLEDFLVADYEAALNTIFTSVSKQAAEVMPQEFARLTVPTLLVSGEYDQIIPAAMGLQAANLNENVEYSLIPQTAHFPMLEDPETYLQQVQKFLGVHYRALA